MYGNLFNGESGDPKCKTNRIVIQKDNYIYFCYFKLKYDTVKFN